jgi:hypothetical protein
MKKTVAAILAGALVIFGVLAAPIAAAQKDILGEGPVGTADAPLKTNSGELTLSGTAENNATIRVYLTTNGGISWVLYAEVQTTEPLPASWSTRIDLSNYVGETFGIASVDSDPASSESYRTLYGYFLYDPSEPQVVITSPAENTTTSGENIQVTGSVTKDAWENYSDLTITLQFMYNTMPITIDSNGGFSYDVALLEGPTTFVVRVTDSLGNSSFAAAMVTRVPASTPTLLIGIFGAVSLIVLMIVVLIKH